MAFGRPAVSCVSLHAAPPLDGLHYTRVFFVFGGL